MSSKLESTQLYKFLKKKNERFAERVRSIRDEQSKWLPLILATFPHYPGHGVEHSERIVEQLSKMLFNESKPVLKFSSAEVYCLLCAIYLHDMGMVVSPKEIEIILNSEGWKDFVGKDGPGHAAYAAIKLPIETSETDGKDRVGFIGAQALRYIVADFVRRDHHERGKSTLEMHPFLKQLITDNDSVAFETIADIGVGHGMNESELADESRFPQERDVFGEKVNVLFLARLLRIGDLLDLDTKRADPMTAKGLATLPTDALPHWKQYSAKRHEKISSMEIEFRFECEDQEVHRVLRDWLGWLEDEVRNAGLGQRHAKRHNKWNAPRCVVESQAESVSPLPTKNATIVIKPTPSAKYKFHDWKLEIDHELVLDRLIYDVYDNSATFVRELIQNALDATRCQMYSDFVAQNPNVAAPERTTQFPPNFRSRYPLLLSLTSEKIKISADGPTELRRVFTIEDRGTGMTEEIIRKYFLQIGRSYYQSNEFRERYAFVPTSRFGVGFLSVFAVSKDVAVETQPASATQSNAPGIKLGLRGPKSYLLTEQWDGFVERPANDKHGTRIRVILSDGALSELKLLQLVENWCRQVEVPIVVREDGQEVVVKYTPLIDGTILRKSFVDSNGTFIIRVFDVDSSGVEGQIVLRAYVDKQGEGWCDCWPHDQNLEGERIDNAPLGPRGYFALNGINFGSSEEFGSGFSRGRSHWSGRLDVRSRSIKFSMSRDATPLRDTRGSAPSVPQICEHAKTRCIENAIENHLAISPRAKGLLGCYYTGKVISSAPTSAAWKLNYPATVVTWQNGIRVDRTAREILSLNRFAIVYWQTDAATKRNPDKLQWHPIRSSLACPIISMEDTPAFVDDELKKVTKSLHVIDAHKIEDAWLIEFGETKYPSKYERIAADQQWYFIDLNDSDDVSIAPKIGAVSSSLWNLVNRHHPVVQWILHIQDAVAKGILPGISVQAISRLWKTVAEEPYLWAERISSWRRRDLLPPDMAPPIDPVYLHHTQLREARTISEKLFPR